MSDERRRRHIQDGGRAFLPQSRMRQIRWEEAVTLSRAKREGKPVSSLRHFDCHCGSIECLGVPMAWPPSSPV